MVTIFVCEVSLQNPKVSMAKMRSSPRSTSPTFPNGSRDTFAPGDGDFMASIQISVFNISLQAYQ
jgi:hypothetical protein